MSLFTPNTLDIFYHIPGLEETVRVIVELILPPLLVFACFTVPWATLMVLYSMLIHRPGWSIQSVHRMVVLSMGFMERTHVRRFALSFSSFRSSRLTVTEIGEVLRGRVRPPASKGSLPLRLGWPGYSSFPSFCVRSSEFGQRKWIILIETTLVMRFLSNLRFGYFLLIWLQFHNKLPLVVSECYDLLLLVEHFHPVFFLLLFELD